MFNSYVKIYYNHVKQPTYCLQSWQAQQPKRGQFGHPNQEDDMACNSTFGFPMFTILTFQRQYLKNSTSITCIQCY